MFGFTKRNGHVRYYGFRNAYCYENISSGHIYKQKMIFINSLNN